VKLEGDRAAIRPIAGTRPRGGTVLEDQALAEELRRDEKENAEHIMLVDLARNDLGRVCRYGTVQVAELMAVERYSHVMHLVSEVTGRLRENEDALSLLCATFPAGTVSGAPKVRAMEIISELEPEPRGPYAGALGYLSFQGNMDTAIIIRTMIREAGEVSFQVGAGIVADSDPEREYLETGSKARAMMNALRILEDDYGCLKRAI
jgi:anthranilate synthase component 1